MVLGERQGQTDKKTGLGLGLLAGENLEWDSGENEKKMRGRSSGGSFSPKLIALLCVASFCIGMLFTNRMWSNPDKYDDVDSSHKRELQVVSQDCEDKPKVENGESRDIMGEVAKTHQAIQGVKYHEPEYWKFGEEGNRYFRHATGQIYAISRDLATYISINSPILHRYANEDVSLGAWFIGLDVEHIDERSMCCGTPPDCEWKAQAGNVCVASFDWTCSGICKSVERLKEVHRTCSEGDGAVWSTLI